MKKILIGLLCTATLMSTTMTAFAARSNNLEVNKNHSAIVMQKHNVQYKLLVDGEKVDLGKLKIIKLKKHIMVPLKVTSEALGFKVTWDKNKNTMHIDNGIMQADLTIGVDSYCAYSSKAIGMTKPVSLGVSPTKLKKTVYVPVEFYKIVFMDKDCVNINGSMINISTNSEDKKIIEDGQSIPSPLVDYHTLDEARKAVKFAFNVPTTMPSSYQMQDIIVISNQIAEVFYKDGENEILYRTAQGSEDISGDYNHYANTNNITVVNTNVTIKGNGDTISLATWVKNGVSYSLSFQIPVNQKVLTTIIESIK